MLILKDNRCLKTSTATENLIEQQDCVESTIENMAKTCLKKLKTSKKARKQTGFPNF